MTREDLTDITMILDRSGSMMSIKEDTEGGFNAFIEEQRGVPGEARVSLVQFDDEYEEVYSSVLVGSVPPVELQPRGSTALLDAVGKTVVATGERLAGMDEEDRPGHVVVVILTDGRENASREWSREKVSGLLQEQQERYAWTFVFLGSNQDAIKTGAGMGVPADYAVTYTGDAVAAAMNSTSHLVTNVRSGGEGGYTQQDRDRAVGR
jgi:uncharacterized protein YegL